MVGLVNIATPYLFKLSIDNLGSDKNNMAVWLVSGYGLIWSLSQTLFFIKNIFAAILSASLERGVSLAMLGELWQPRLYVENYSFGHNYEKFQRASKGFSSITTNVAWTIVPAIVELVSAAIMLSVLVSIYVAIILVVVVVLCFVASIASAKISEMVVKKINNESNKLASGILERMSFSESIILMNAMNFEIKSISNRYDNWLKVVIHGNKTIGFFFSGKILIIGAGLCLSLLVTAYEIKAGRLSVGDFAMVNGYVIQFSMPMIYLAASVFDIKKNIASLEEATSFLSVRDKSVGNIYEARSMIPLELNGVVPAIMENKFRPVSLTLHLGEIVGMKGVSGIGKSSLFDVLLGFLGYHGQIDVYGIPKNDIDIDSYRKLIGGVRQNAQIITGTLKENIAYGFSEFDEEKLKQVCEIACLNEFVATREDGMNFAISQNGGNLSGGEKMRIAIARVLYRCPKIILLDEPTAALDAETEKRLMNNLKAEGVTAIIISHSPGCLALCDRVVELQGENNAINSGEVTI